MSLIQRISRRLDTDYHRYQFGRTAKHISKTAPLNRGELPFTVLSMVHHRDVYPYLIAIRSFALHANPQRIIVVCDPTLDKADQAIIRQQVPHIEFRHADEFVHPDIPRGGCWERLYAISEYAKSDYIIQLDADTVTTAPIPEVVDAACNQKGFVIGEKPDQKLVTFDEAEQRARPWQRPGVHIQGLSEFLLRETTLPNRMYVRGCAGFTGFPPEAGIRDMLLEFSRQMQQQTGLRWKEWGTEQVASNYLVANLKGTTVLPFPKYGTPDVIDHDTCFIHFIGSMRFINSTYEKTAHTSIQHLNHATN